jgi:L-ascorbate metabolism protein UlaG (beta-lactamase superfamily)
MIITYHGDGCVRLQYGESVLLFNPPSKSAQAKTVRSNAQGVLLSARVPYVEERPVATDGESGFTVFGPGEYEVNGAFIQGFPSQTQWGGEIQINTLYVFPFEEMKIVHLGFLNHTDLDPSFTQVLDDIDVLFVPISGTGTLGPSESYELAVKLQPRLIIPIVFSSVEDDVVKQFLRESGTSVDPEEKITIKKRDIVDLENVIRILIPQG